MDEILEHEILRILYTLSNLTIIKTGNQIVDYTPLYKRTETKQKIHFGTLVHILNNPSLFTTEKSIFEISKSSLKEKDITQIPYDFYQVSDAVDVLSYNEHIDDYAPESAFSNIEERTVSIKDKGIIDYRNDFYIKKAALELSVYRQYEIQKRDLWLKKYWIIVEIAKYVLGGVIGALIALAATRIGK
jgi:hypothetical protein